MKRQIATILTAVIFTLTPTIARANFDSDTSYKDDYSWDMSDSDQKKMATGMLMWGFFLALASALLSAFIPNSTTPAGSTPPTPPPAPPIF